MKHHVRKLLSIVLALCLTAGFIPTQAVAEGETTYTVTLNLTKLTAKYDDSSDVASPVTVTDSGTFTATLAPEAGCTLPESITVTGIGAVNDNLQGASSDGEGSYYNKSTGKVHIAAVSNDVVITAYAVEPAASFTVELRPNDSAAKWAAGSSAAFDIILAQTSAETNGGAVQTMDFSIGFDQNMTYVSSAPADGNGLEFIHTDDSSVLEIKKTGGVGINIGVGSSVTLGTVTFALPAGDFVNTNCSSAGKYRLTDFTIAADGIIATSKSGSGVCPTAVQYSSEGLYAMNAYLTMPADYAALHISGISYKVGAGEYASAGQGTSILFPYNTECAIQIIADTGYSLNTGSAAYTMADGAIGTFTYVGTSGNVYTFSTADNKDLSASGTLTFTTAPIQYNIIYDENGGTTVTDGSYNIESSAAAFPDPPAKDSYTFAGWKVTAAAAGGTGMEAGTLFAADAVKADISGCYGDVTLQAQWTAAPNALSIVVTDANASAKNTASIIPVSGIGGAAGSYTVNVETAGVFAVAPSAGYVITGVFLANNNAGTEKAALTADENGKYTIPISDTAAPVWVFVATSIDTGQIYASAATSKDTTDADMFTHYSVYSGQKSLVKFRVNNENITALGLNGITVYKTDKYSGYNCIALVDISSVAEKTDTALNTYLQSILKTQNTSSTIEYTNDINLQNGFLIDDISVAYDFTSLDTVNWHPQDTNLLLGDLNHDGVMDSADVALLVDAYN